MNSINDLMSSYTRYALTYLKKKTQNKQTQFARHTTRHPKS